MTYNETESVPCGTTISFINSYETQFLNLIF